VYYQLYYYVRIYIYFNLEVIYLQQKLHKLIYRRYINQICNQEQYQIVIFVWFLIKIIKYLHIMMYWCIIVIELISYYTYYLADGRKLVKPFCYNVRLPERTMLFYRITLLFVQYLVPVVIITVVYMRMALRLWGSHAPGNAQDSRDANLMRNKKKVRI